MSFRFLHKILFLCFFAIATLASAQSNNRLSEADYVNIYPNPVVNEATIKINESIDLERHKISIVLYNIVGKEVYKVSNIKESEIRFNRDGLQSGMYIYQLKVDEKTQSTGRITFK